MSVTPARNIAVSNRVIFQLLRIVRLNRCDCVGLALARKIIECLTGGLDELLGDFMARLVRDFSAIAHPAHRCPVPIEVPPHIGAALGHSRPPIRRYPLAAAEAAIFLGSPCLLIAPFLKV
jgi:hypothetical protein